MDVAFTGGDDARGGGKGGFNGETKQECELRGKACLEGTCCGRPSQITWFHEMEEEERQGMESIVQEKISHSKGGEAFVVLKRGEE